MKYLKGNSTKIKPPVKANTPTPKVMYTKEILLTVFLMEKGNNYTKMVNCIKEPLKMALRVVMENTLGLTGPTTKENGKIMSLKVMVNINGPMVEITLAYGKTIRCMDRVKWSFQTVEFIKENLKTIK